MQNFPKTAWSWGMVGSEGVKNYKLHHHQQRNQNITFPLEHENLLNVFVFVRLLKFAKLISTSMRQELCSEQRYNLHWFHGVWILIFEVMWDFNPISDEHTESWNRTRVRERERARELTKLRVFSSIQRKRTTDRIHPPTTTTTTTIETVPKKIYTHIFYSYNQISIVANIIAIYWDGTYLVAQMFPFSITAIRSLSTDEYIKQYWISFRVVVCDTHVFRSFASQSISPFRTFVRAFRSTLSVLVYTLWALCSNVS